MAFNLDEAVLLGKIHRLIPKSPFPSENQTYTQTHTIVPNIMAVSRGERFGDDFFNVISAILFSNKEGLF
jgi:hypothetical protein